MTSATMPEAKVARRELPVGRGAEGAGEGRYHSLDALRGFALLLGVAFHAAESFHPGVGAYWAIADNAPSHLLAWVRHGCHSFRMEIFFLIAGFFARLVLERRGTRAFLANRAGRILVPLVVGWAVLFPLVVYLWMLGASLSGRLAQFGVPAEFAQAPPWQLALGFFLSLEFVRKFDWTHLWFLHQLLMVYGLMLICRWGIAWLPGGGKGVVGAIDRAVGGVYRGWWAPLALGVVTVPMLMWMREWGVDTPKNSILPYPPTTALYGLCFAAGWFLHRQPELLEEFSRRWWGYCLLGLVGMILTAQGADWVRQQGWVRGEAVTMWRWTYSMVYALMMWGFVFGFLGVFVRFRREPSATWRYVADSSYWIYLAHLPLVVALQILVANWALPWPVKLGFILLVAVPLLFVTYKYLVRSTFIGAQLNGRRYPR